MSLVSRFGMVPGLLIPSRSSLTKAQAVYTPLLSCYSSIVHDSSTTTVHDVRPPVSNSVDMNNYGNANLNDVRRIISELTDGKGFYRIENCFPEEDIDKARGIVMANIRSSGRKATHFQGQDESKIDLQARVWNLLNKGKVFMKMTQHPKVMEIGDRLLGDDFQIGSIASNTLFPGAVGQEPHIDYPYWDYYERKHWPIPPKVEHVPFHMNMQVTVLLDDFTNDNGSTAVVPGTQKIAKYPNKEEFFSKYIHTTGKAGDIVIFLGLLHHCAMPNNSNEPRTGLILQYLPKFVRPMEDVKKTLRADVIENASPRMRRLLCLDYPYPSVLDDAAPNNTEGSLSNFKWKTYD